MSACFCVRLALWCALAGTIGCGFLGATPIKVGRGRFNDAVQQTGKEQLLLNLVRLRYGDIPSFLEVAGVSGSYNFGANVGGSATIPTTGLEIFGASLAGSTSEAPTISYAPLQGEQFARQLLTPLDLDSLLLLYHSGWPINWILRVCVQRLNNLPNAESATGPILEETPNYEAFANMTWNLRYLQQKGALQLGRLKEPNDGKEMDDKEDSKASTEIVLRLSEDFRLDEDAKTFEAALGVEEGREEYVLTRAVAPQEKNRIAVVTRSLMGVMFYLSKAVEVPSEDDEAGLTVMRKGGDIEAWQNAYDGMFQISNSLFCPNEAFAAVSHFGRCFYIAQDDVDSKATFSLVTQLLALQASPVNTNLPVLTIPVGR